MKFKTTKSLWQFIVVCITIMFSSPFVCAQNDSQAPPSSLLDDLLAPSTDQSKQAEQGTDSKAVRTLSEELNVVSSQMDMAATSLTGSNQITAVSVEQALKHQQEAIDALNRLLQKNGGKMSSQSSGDKGAGREQSDAKEPNQPKNAPPGQQPDDKQSQSPPQEPQSGDKPGKQSSQSDPNSSSQQNDQQDPSGKTTGQDAKGAPTKETVVDLLKSIDTSGKANWGKLPRRLREQMQNTGSLEFTRGYEQQTRDYFRNLNEALLKMQKPPAK